MLAPPLCAYGALAGKFRVLRFERSGRERIRSMVKKVDSIDGGPTTAEEFAHTLPDRLLHCRELGHTWRHYTVTYDEDARCYDRALRCSSCRTIRVQVLDTRGHVLRNGYKYPDGYLVPGSVDRVGASRDAYRVEAVVRFLQAAEPTPKLRGVS